jgi:transposase
MEFRELSDGEWEVIRPLLPPRASVGRPRIDDRLVVNGILYVLVTGCRWMDLPARYGSYKTCWDRFRRWSVMGVWSKILEALIAMGYSNGKLRLDRVLWIVLLLRLEKGGAYRV